MTTDSYITIRVSVDICLISSICLKQLSKKVDCAAQIIALEAFLDVSLIYAQRFC